MIKDGSGIRGVISILIRRVPFLKRTIFYAPRGPIIDFEEEEVFETLLEALSQGASEKRGIFLKIDPEIKEDSERAKEIIIANGFRACSSQVQPRCTFLIDLDKDEDELLKGFKSKTRYNIRLAERKGVKVEEAHSEEDIERFYKILRETSARDKFLLHSIKYYQGIWELLRARDMASLFLAHYRGEMIAASLIFKFGDWCWYMYGASSHHHREVMPNQAIHWYIMRKMKEEGYKTYDLWGIPCNPQPDHPLWGVYRFKAGFQGRLVKFIGAYDLPFSPLYRCWGGLETTYKTARSLLFKGTVVDSLRE